MFNFAGLVPEPSDEGQETEDDLAVWRSYTLSIPSSGINIHILYYIFFMYYIFSFSFCIAILKKAYAEMLIKMLIDLS